MADVKSPLSLNSSDAEGFQTIPSERDLKDYRLGDFRLLCRLARGGMAEVYLAEQVSLKRRVALKILRAELAADLTFIRRFRVEAEAAARINHPNIVQVYAVGEEKGVHYIAQEYVPGHNLRAFLVRQGPPDGPTAVAIMRQVALALNEAADRGIVHRDIKPENILLTPRGEVKVADFGLARSGNTSSNLTQVGITMGTPLYMSPEQIEGKPLDHRSDQYSFGVTCYHMLSGSPPFRGDTALSVAVAHLKSEPAPLWRLRPDLPKGFYRIIARMMAKDPANRYSSIADVVTELERLASRASLCVADRRSNRLGETFSASGWAPFRWADRGRLFSPWRSNRWRSLLRAPLVGAYVVAVLAALMLGGAAGWWSRGPDLLSQSPSDREMGVEKMPTAEQQALFAHLAQGSDHAEAAWEAVVEYWPDDQEKQMQAKQELALLFLQQARDDEASEIFGELAQEKDPALQEFRAFGLAGLIAVGGEPRSEADQAEILALVEQLYPLAAELGRSSANRRIRQLQVMAMQKLYRTLENEQAERWDTFLEGFTDAEDDNSESPARDEANQ